MIDVSNLEDLASKAAAAAGMFRAAAAPVAHGEPSLDPREVGAAFAALADYLEAAADEAGDRALSESLEDADLFQPEEGESGESEEAEYDRAIDLIFAAYLEGLEPDDLPDLWERLDRLFDEAGETTKWPKIQAELARYRQSRKARPAAPEGEAEGEPEEADLDLLLDRLLARFLRRLEADDWVAWLALDAIFTSHAPTLEWPEVKEALAEYRRTGKVTRRNEGSDDQVKG